MSDMEKLKKDDKFKEFDCLDCGVNTLSIDEYYMVQFGLWDKATSSARSGMLCIGCLETRIGRTLTSEDFIEAPINYGFFGASQRMRDRLGPKFTEHTLWMEGSNAYHDS